MRVDDNNRTFIDQHFVHHHHCRHCHHYHDVEFYIVKSTNCALSLNECAKSCVDKMAIAIMMSNTTVIIIRTYISTITMTDTITNMIMITILMNLKEKTLLTLNLMEGGVRR